MACVYDGGVLVGADSRTTSGTYIADRVADKLDYVHDRIFCLRSGNIYNIYIIFIWKLKLTQIRFRSRYLNNL